MSAAMSDEEFWRSMVVELIKAVTRQKLPADDFDQRLLVAMKETTAAIDFQQRIVRPIQGGHCRVNEHALDLARICISFGNFVAWNKGVCFNSRLYPKSDDDDQ
jgi:hypothetical protein